MFKYEKMLEYPINIKKKDLKMAKLLADQLGGPNGELGACLRYLCQRFTMPDEKGRTLLSDIGCEEIGHCEMISSMMYQLIEGASIEEIKSAIVDLTEDLAAEEKARKTYENLMDLTNDPDLLAPLSFLRQREVVHYNRFKELLDYYKSKGM